MAGCACGRRAFGQKEQDLRPEAPGMAGAGQPPEASPLPAETLEYLDDFIARRTAEGGADIDR